MSDRIVTSITLYGEINDNPSSWLKWYEDAKELVSSLGYDPNYVGIESTTLHSGKVHKIKSYEKRLIRAIESGDKVESLDVMSLPPDYSTAAFDYEVDLIRTMDFVNLAVNKSDFDSADKDMLLDILRRHVVFKEGEIYEMNRGESPFFYAAKANPSSFFKTLKIIKKLS